MDGFLVYLVLLIMDGVKRKWTHLKLDGVFEYIETSDAFKFVQLAKAGWLGMFAWVRCLFMNFSLVRRNKIGVKLTFGWKRNGENAAMNLFNQLPDHMFTQQFVQWFLFEWIMNLNILFVFSYFPRRKTYETKSSSF